MGGAVQKLLVLALATGLVPAGQFALMPGAVQRSHFA